MKLFRVDSDIYLDDTKRRFFQDKVITVILGAVSLVMTIINIFTGKTVLMLATLAFAVFCAVDYIVLQMLNRSNLFSSIGFDAAIVFLFSYFIITGGTAGFSPLWILILPACGMIFFGFLHGGILSGGIFLIVAGYLWTPLYGIFSFSYSYSEEFRMRFPVVYISFFALGFTFEAIRLNTFKKVKEAQQQAIDAANGDNLTGLHNRYWFTRTFLNDYDRKIIADDSMLLMMSIDNYHTINDLYGHMNGDALLEETANVICRRFDESVMKCHWNLGQFLLYIPSVDAAQAKEMCDGLKQDMDTHHFLTSDGMRIACNVSIGALVLRCGEMVEGEKALYDVDRNLLSAQKDPTNAVVITHN